MIASSPGICFIYIALKWNCVLSWSRSLRSKRCSWKWSTAIMRPKTTISPTQPIIALITDPRGIEIFIDQDKGSSEGKGTTKSFVLRITYVKDGITCHCHSREVTAVYTVLTYLVPGSLGRTHRRIWYLYVYRFHRVDGWYQPKVCFSRP